MEEVPVDGTQCVARLLCFLGPTTTFFLPAVFQTISKVRL